MKKSSAKSSRPGGAAKFPRVRDKIRRRILKGKYPPGSQMPTELDLSAELLVNPLTIRRALQDLVNDGLVVRRRGSGTFVAEHLLPPLIPGRHLHIGLIWPHSISAERCKAGFEGEITQGILKHWQLDGIEGVYPPSANRHPTRGFWKVPERGVDIVGLGEAWDITVRHPPLAAVRDGRFDGLIAVGVVEEEWLEQVADLEVPLVLADFSSVRLVGRADQVYVDHLPGIQMAVDSLVACGCERIHFVGERVHLPAPDEAMSHSEWSRLRIGHSRIDPDSGRRLSALVQALIRHERLLPERAIHFCLNASPEYEALGRTLAALPLDEQPQALICNSVKAAGILKQQFEAAGRALRTVAATSSPNVGDTWGIHADPADLGAAAAELLLSRLKQPQRKTFNVGIRTYFIRDGESFSDLREPGKSVLIESLRPQI